MAPEASPLIACVVSLPRALPAVLGVGAYLKNAPCLIQGREAWIGRPSGSLDNVESVRRFEETARGLLALAKEPPVLIAHDLHPDFPCTRWALEQGIRALAVQHHHAHAAAVLAENGMEGPALALALDGFGLGADGGAWGGELLRIASDGFGRLGHLKALRQPGGDVAARQPWRMGAAALWSMGRGGEIAARFAAHKGAAHMAAMMERAVGSPWTSSAGRLFDAACGLLGVMPVAQEEGQAPMELEAMAARAMAARTVAPYAEGWRLGKDMVLDMTPLLARLADWTGDKKEGAALFHATLTFALVAWAGEAAAREGARAVALCGGCFLNALLKKGVEEGLKNADLVPLFARQMSAGDGAIALGQAYAAATGLCQGAGR